MLKGKVHDIFYYSFVLVKSVKSVKSNIRKEKYEETEKKAEKRVEKRAKKKENLIN